VLITGRAGFIGSYLVNRVIRDRYEVRIVDNLSSGRIENTKHHLSANSVELIIGDLKDSQTAV
jgi:UDP-glucose 4-epimerase